MKTRILCAIVAVACSATCSLLAETVNFNSLPLAVQDAINAQRGPAGIVSIRRINRVGTPVYDVRLDRSGINNEFYITDTGAVVNGSELIAVPPSGVAETREMSFSMLPTAVQNTVRAELGNVATPNADMITVNGQTTYVVPARIEGRLTDLWSDPTGNLITLSPPRILLSHATTMSPDQLPTAVQDTLRNYAAGAPILNVIRGDVQGLTVYDATISRNGHTTDLRIASDGSLVRDGVNDRYLAETGRMTRAALAVNAPVRIPLRDPVSVSFNQLPLPVLSTLQTYAGADFVEHIDRGLADGRTQYEALFRHTGEEIPLRIAEDGALVHDRINDLFLANYGGTHPLGLGVAPSTQVGFGSSTAP